MSGISARAVLRYIHTLVAGQMAEGEPDENLVEAFASCRQETAFAALLERHGPMVLSVCLRTLQDEHLAEDAFQATFLILARNAGTIRNPAAVASWLHGVALRLSRKLKTDAIRSRQPVQAKRSPPTPDTPMELSWREQREILDEEMQRLPEKYRLPLVLCYLEGRTHDEAALQLGWPTGKLRGLLDRGRERLRSQLVRRGVTLVSAGAGALLADTALSAAVPPLLAVATVKASLLWASGTPLAASGVSASVAALAEGAVIVGSKKMLVALALALVFAIAGAGTWANSRHDPAMGRAALAAGPDLHRPALPEPASPDRAPDSEVKPDAPLPDGAMRFHFFNNTRGKFADAQIYWAVIGNGANYLDRDGNLVRMQADDNTAPGHLTKDGVDYANYFHRLTQARSVVVPKMNSGRLYLSVGAPMYIRVAGTGYTAADVANPADPNRDVYFDFVEFTLDDRGFHGNTTQVDAFGFPLTIEAVDASGTSRMAGISESRSALFAAFRKETPPEFAACVQEPYRIVAPCSAGFGKGQPNGNYFDSYLDQVWETYAEPTKLAGGYAAEVINGALEFTHASGKKHRVDRKPTTQEAFLGNGVLAKSPQLCAAINRHVLADPTDWSKPARYYQAGPANYYARFWHDHSINGRAYGFSYDDAQAQDSLIDLRRPARLNVSLSWD